MIASSGPASLAIESIPAYVDLEEVPAYDAIVSTSSNQTPAPSTEHVYTLSRSDTTITFKLKSDAPATRSSPLYFKLSNITGSVHIEVRNKSNVRAVSVKVEGARVVSAMSSPRDFGQYTFAQALTILWPPKPTGESRSTNAETLGRGSHSWDLAIRFPDSATDSKTGSTYALPPSFSLSGYPQFIQYSIEVTVERKGLLAVDDKLSTRFHYFPRSVPGPPTELRQMAYADGTPLLGPQLDPLGFVTQPSVTLAGRLFGTVDVTVDCTFALALPAQYPRGYPLPFFLIFKSSDVVALDVIASTQSVSVSLKRSFTFGHESPTRTKYTPIEDTVGTAVCWISPNESHEGSVKAFQGEIVVRKDLLPSFETPSIFLAYSIQVSLQAAGFVSGENTKELFSVPVVITMNCAPGVKPRSYAPAPRYERDLASSVASVPPEYSRNVVLSG